MKYMSRFCILLVLGFSAPGVWAQDLADLTPDLRYSVYSTTAAELFWDRVADDQGAPVYELVHNGELVWSGDALSFYETALDPAIDNTYELTVVGVNGSVSNTALVTFSTQNGVPTAARPNAPTGIEANVSSQTSATIVWEADVDSASVNFEIRRNGEQISTLDGDVNSYTDNALEAGTYYYYEVFTVDTSSEGNLLSIAAAVSFTTPGTAQAPINDALAFSDANIANMLNNIARTLNGSIFNTTFDEAQRLVSASTSGLSLIASSERASNQTKFYECEGGGSLTQFIQQSGAVTTIATDLDGCVVEGKTYMGDMNYVKDSIEESLTLNSLSVVSASGNSSITSGTLSSSTLNGGTRRLEVSSYEELNFDGARRPVTNFLTASAPTDVSSESTVAERLVSFWTASGPWSNDVAMTAETTEPFKREEGEVDFFTGTLTVKAESGMVMTINADNGDSLSFGLTVVNGQNSQDYTVPWTSDNRFGLVSDLSN